MVTKPLFRRNFFLFWGILILFIVISYALSGFLAGLERQRFEKFIISPPHANSKMILYESGGDPVETLRRIRKIPSENPEPFELDIASHDGKSFVDGLVAIDPPLSDQEKTDLREGKNVMRKPKDFGPPSLVIMPTKNPAQLFVVKNRADLIFRSAGGPPPMPPPPMGMGEGPRGPHGGPPRPPPGSRFLGIPGPPGMFAVSFGLLLFCTLLAVGVSLTLFFSNYRAKGEEAMRILNEMKAGNLEARMPVTKFDELTPLVQSFNLMAEEIQRLVGSLKKSDATRRELLQDLAHDLRTPLASLRSFLETLASAGERLSQEKRTEIFQVCLSEVDYFARLVDDLLFLSQMTEPRYSLSAESVDIENQIQSQIAVFQTREAKIQFKFEHEGQTRIAPVKGSEKLLSRLFRNAFANAASFAQSEVRVRVRQADRQVQIIIEDDGPGFTEKALKEFGTKKFSREVSADPQSKRISVGIGSVIMREIALLHRGNLAAENREAPAHGARLLISLPNDSTKFQSN